MPKAWNDMRLNVPQYLAQVRHPALTPDQQGRLALAWPTVYLAGESTTSTEETWRRALGYSSQAWPEVAGAYADALPGWRLPLLVDEAQRQAGVSQANSIARQRALTCVDLAVASSSTSKSKDKNLRLVKEPEVKIADMPLPPCVPREVWVDWCIFRDSLKPRTPWTPQAAKLAMHALNDLNTLGYSPKEVVEQSILNGWKGLFAVKGQAVAAPASPDKWFFEK